jgi:hypothetical protein
VSDQQHADERRCSRTAKSCGPDAPTLASSFAEFCRPDRAVTKQYPRGNGGKRARSPRRARHKPLKPLRAGMPGDSGVLVVTRVRSTNTKCTRDRGCSGHPAFPTPSLGRKINAQLGRIAPRGREVVCGLEFEVVAERKRPRLRHSGPMPTGPREARPDDRLRIEPGISRFPDAQLRI